MLFNAEEEKRESTGFPAFSKRPFEIAEYMRDFGRVRSIVGSGLMYAARLEDAGVEVEYHILKGMVHGVFELDIWGKF